MQTAKVTGVKPKAEPDGSHMIQVTTADGTKLDVSIPAPDAAYR